MYKILFTAALVATWIPHLVVTQSYPDTTFLVGVNCDLAGIYAGDCSSVSTPYLNIKDSTSDSYPSSGFCIARDLSMGGSDGPVSYTYTGSVCSGYGSFGGGIFFNFQDVNNYDTFFTKDEYSSLCYVGHVENGVAVDVASFDCKPGTDSITWIIFEVQASPGSATVLLRSYDGDVGDQYTYTPHFDTNPEAGPLHLNSDNYHGHLHFAESTMTIVPITTEPPVGTGIPPLNGPQYNLRLSGDYTSSTGTDFDDSCSASYSYEMDRKTGQMGQVINNIIGSTLCAELTLNEVKVVLTSGQMTFDGSTGNARLSFHIEVSQNLFMSQIEACVTDITAYVLPYTNWGAHVVPPVNGCPEVDFTGTQFNDDNDFWLCLDESSNSGPALSALEPPKYSVSHDGLFDVEGGADLNADCQEVYRTFLLDNTNAMLNDINNPSGTHLCGNLNVNVYLQSVFLSAQSGQGVTIQDYHIEPSGDMRFADIYGCSDTISAHLIPHTNWMDPIIPPFATCPTLTFNPEQFSERSQQWVCLAQSSKYISEADDKEKSQVTQDNDNKNNQSKSQSRSRNHRPHVNDMRTKFLRYLKNLN